MRVGCLSRISMAGWVGGIELPCGRPVRGHPNSVLAARLIRRLVKRTNRRGPPRLRRSGSLVSAGHVLPVKRERFRSPLPEPRPNRFFRVNRRSA
jgi:hypothetical protein